MWGPEGVGFGAIIKEQSGLISFHEETSGPGFILSGRGYESTPTCNTKLSMAYFHRSCVHREKWSWPCAQHEEGLLCENLNIHLLPLIYTPGESRLLAREGWVMARTNIVLDEHLVRQGLKVSGCKSKRELVDLALREFLKTAKRRELLALRGQVRWEGDLDRLRRSRTMAS